MDGWIKDYGLIFKKIWRLFMKNKIGDKERLGHVLDCIAFIEKSLSGINQDEFNENFILHTAVQK